ncbi:hypothetical protein EZS27_020973 [termite gut metagenome]|uniref:DUF4465 domain-containing protein n=1 Tax=termite gut metagenome TaxID=433724 RepID=A0A5J4RAC2_9ZZZZ
MKKLYVLTLLSVLFAFYGCQKDDEKEIVVINFEGLLNGANQEFITSNGVKINESDPYSSYRANFEDPSHILQFDHYYYNSDGGSFGGGFTYTNSTDNSTPGYLNISAFTAKGHSGDTYLTAYIDNRFALSQITNLQSGKYKFTGAWVTNSTYAYLAVKEGDDGGGEGSMIKGKFTAGDYFILTATGYDNNDTPIGEVSFYLADFRNGKSNVVNNWSWIDFTPLASAEYIKFEMFSTDTGTYGMNTPSYFCMDDITLTEK